VETGPARSQQGVLKRIAVVVALALDWSLGIVVFVAGAISGTPFLGEISDESIETSGLLMIVSGVVLALGPFVMWRTTGSRAWNITAVVLLLIPTILGLSVLLEN
jgi:hypothetical protein